MGQTDVLHKLIVRGSDELVDALYHRLRADRMAMRGVAPESYPAKTWSELADWAVAEDALSPEEARRLSEAEGVAMVPGGQGLGREGSSLRSVGRS